MAAIFDLGFIGRKVPPTEADLAVVLGSVKPLWDELLTLLAREQGIEPEPWKSYSPKAGWSLPLRLAKRRIVYLAPGHGFFLASFALGDKAVAAWRGRSPAVAREFLRDAKRYPEGTAIRIQVRTPEDLMVVRDLAAIKLAN
ncbi:MAG TPA: DUF3788 family protein [Candidatus Acidoferrales bacterium]|nr:DUF3788 family protein [Candidatus Acidoferrales bacterium]HXK07351.1 DUF3788 family protein [Verrucomicrobiae bacterium]